ncbi:MAG TPA: hydroxyacid dehydrogenase, partial [Pantoea agglomerans]|nr:hydroxyacid dehydrogenase [Pantoea agglomerans]
NTVAAQHTRNPIITVLKLAGNMTLVRAPEHDRPAPQVFSLIVKRRSIAGSLIGGVAETQEMLDFCGEHGITSDIELIAMDQINEAYERMLKSDVKYRFVIDINTLREQPAA